MYTLHCNAERRNFPSLWHVRTCTTLRYYVHTPILRITHISTEGISSISRSPPPPLCGHSWLGGLQPRGKGPELSSPERERERERERVSRAEYQRGVCLSRVCIAQRERGHKFLYIFEKDDDATHFRASFGGESLGRKLGLRLWGARL